jgi:hypothetical protein
MMCGIGCRIESQWCDYGDNKIADQAPASARASSPYSTDDSF